MHVYDLRTSLRFGMPVLAAFLASTFSFAQAPKPLITLDPVESRFAVSRMASREPVRGEASFANPPANFRSFRSAKVGEIADVERVTLRFSASTKITKITSTGDFRVEQGSSCVEGNAYDVDGSCTLLVRFTPKGAGRRLGKVAIAHTGSTTPFYVGLGGNGYAPVLSFTPALITTVASSFPASKGLLNGAGNLYVDGGDTLYVADTGNNVIRAMDSSGVFNTISSGTLSAPYGIAADSFGDVYFSEPAAGLMYEIFNYGSQVQISGTGTDSCTVAAPCSMPNEKVYSPGQLSMDYNNQIFFVEQSLGAATGAVLPYSPKLARIYDPFTYQAATPGVMTVDAYDNLYSAWITTGVCSIVSQTFSDSSNSRGVYKKVAGGRACGFTGDGGQARNAEISTTMGQFAFDVAGNMYFTDTGNQRVRRIDNATGIISTIAGNGSVGYGGDGGASTNATLSKPTGVAVDSQGQVYIISTAGTSGTAQVIRKLGPNGAVNFDSRVRGTVSGPRTVTLANTGNSTLTFTKAFITGTNASDFSIDPNTTTCLLTPGSTLANGQSCKVGIIFAPAQAGTRGASLVFLDNTVTNSNTIQLAGGATLPAATFAITAPTPGTSVVAGTTVKFSVSVTSATGAAPTGTVKFSLGSTVISAATAISGGVAAVNVTGLTAGTQTLSAVYSGDANYAPAGPIAVALTVTAAPAVVKLATAPAASCHTVAFTVDVTGGASLKGTGQVQLLEGTKVLGSSTLTNGSAAVSLAGLASGTHTISASYSGDTNLKPAVSAGIKQTVRAGGMCSPVTSSPIRVAHRPVAE